MTSALIALLALSQQQLPAELQTQLDALDGYQRATWGQSRKQLQKLYPKAKIDKDGWLALEAPVAGVDATTVFYFAQDRLKGVVVTFGNAPGRPVESVFSATFKALKDKYGSAGDGDASVGGAGWLGEKTHISLKLELLPRRVVLTYRSVALAALEDQVTPEQAKDL